MSEIPQQLGGALRPGAADGGAVLITAHRRAAHRADVRQEIGCKHCKAFFLYNAQYFWDDLPRLLHHHRIADADILLGDEVLVVEGGVGDGGARQAHG